MVKDKISGELLKRIITAVVLIAMLPLILSGNFIWTLSMVGIALLAWREWWNIAKDFNVITIGAGSAYIATAIASAIYLRELHGGVALICFSLSCVIAMDTAAYFGGKRFGKTLLAPKISPKKTLEGLGCGLLAALLVGAMFSPAFENLFEFNWFITIIFAMIIALISQGGDLLVSFFKRKSGVKDSGNILPGHGGVLDRIDGHLAAFITLFLLLMLYE
jgi:phosphatidate cytidylyltransferase